MNQKETVKLGGFAMDHLFQISQKIMMVDINVPQVIFVREEPKPQLHVRKATICHFQEHQIKLPVSRVGLDTIVMEQVW